MFRSIEQYDITNGTIFLHSMPGRRESLEDFTSECEKVRISTIVQLTSLDEIGRKSPKYFELLEKGDEIRPRIECPIPDFKMPLDQSKFLDTINRAALLVHRGENILVHCGAGIGRTGLFATCLLMRLGFSLEESEDMVDNAGSGAETDEQQSFVKMFSDVLSHVINDIK